MGGHGYLRCRECGTRYYSVDARRRVQADERCTCGGPLAVLTDDDYEGDVQNGRGDCPDEGDNR